jgi:hypothetical protein
MTAQFDYDVALSFHSKDESVATQLNDLLQERFATFLYSKKQDVLAGTDGEVSFNAAFEKQARMVVVFYRKEWGETTFTRVEQTAIKNRAFNAGYDFTLFIPMDKPTVMPPWVPKTQLYYGLERFGVSGVAAVVEQRIQVLGGAPRIEGIADRAARLQRARDFQNAKERFHRGEGVAAADAAAERLALLLEQHVSDFASKYPSLSRAQFKKFSENWLISGIRPCALIYWCRRYTNSLDESFLGFELYDGVPRIPGVMAFQDAPRISGAKYDYELLGIDRHGYVERSRDKRSFAPDELADHILRIYMDAVERYVTR